MDGELQNETTVTSNAEGCLGALEKEAGGGGHPFTSVVMGERIKKRLSEDCKC